MFGRNATGGVIHYLTRGADDDEINGYVEASAAEFGKFSVEGAVGGAFSDTARYRFAARRKSLTATLSRPLSRRAIRSRLVAAIWAAATGTRFAANCSSI